MYFLLILVSCKDDEVNILTIEDIEGTWSCSELLQAQCILPENNGTQSCSDLLVFNSDASCMYLGFQGTFTLANNQVTFILDLSGVPSGIDDQTVGMLELAPFNVSLNNNVLSLAGTTRNSDDCFATASYTR